MNFSLTKSEFKKNLTTQLQKLQEFGEKGYSKVTEPLGKIANQIVDLTKIDKKGKKRKIGHISVGKLQTPHDYLEYIAGAIKFSSSLIHKNISLQQERFEQKGLNGKQEILEYIKGYLISDGLSDGLDIMTEIRLSIERITIGEKQNLINMKIDELEELISGRELVNSDGKYVSDKDVIKIYRSYLDYKRHTLVEKYLYSFLNIGIDIYAIIGKINNTKETTKLIKRMLMFAGLEGLYSYLKDLSLEDKIMMGELISEYHDLSDYKSSTSFVTKEEREDIKDSIEETSELASKEEEKIHLYESLVAIIYSTVHATMVGYMLYKEFKDKEKIDAEELSNIIFQITKSVNILGSINNTIDNLRNMKSVSSVNGRSFEKMEADVETFLDQAEKIKKLKEASNPIEKIVIMHGKIKPTNREWEIYCPEDITIISGNCVYIEGDEGAGKSTLIDLLVGGDINSENIMTVNGEELVDNLESQTAIYKKGKTSLLGGASVLTKITNKKSPTKEDEKIVGEILNSVGYHNVRLDAEKGHSLGQDEKLLISRTLYRVMTDKKPILFLDEPVGQVKRESKEKLMELICGYASRYNKIVFISSHEKDLAEKYATFGIHVEGIDEEQRTITRYEIEKSKEEDNTAGPNFDDDTQSL